MKTPNANSSSLESDSTNRNIQRRLHRAALDAQVGLPTPAYYSRRLSNLAEAPIVLKLDHTTITGSYKIRGALNAFLSAAEKCGEICAASSGNFAIAVSYLGRRLNIPVRLFVPNNIDQTKLDQLHASGVEVCVGGKTLRHAEIAAKEYVSSHPGTAFLSAYDDWNGWQGHTSIAIEVEDQIEIHAGDALTLFFPVGGAGLASAAYAGFVALGYSVKLVAVEMRGQDSLHASLRDGRLQTMAEVDPRLSATAVPRPGNIAWSICQDNADVESLTVSYEQVVEAWRLLYSLRGDEFPVSARQVPIELSGALATAGLLNYSRVIRGTGLVAVTGANISAELEAALLAG